MFNNMQIIINIFSCILFVYFIHQIYVFKFTHKYTSVPPYFAPHRSIWAFDHTNSLIFIHNVAYFAQNKKSTPFHKEVDGNLNLNLIL